MKCELVDPFVIKTDIVGDLNFFQPYLDQMEWTDTNVAYTQYDEYHESMLGRPMVRHYIKHFDPADYDMALKKHIVKLFKDFGVPTQDFRADFYLTKAGGSLPMHVDAKTRVAFLLPLTKNTGPLVCEHGDERLELTYQTLTILNSKINHGVAPPTEDRLLFRIGVHDVNFEDLGIYQQLTT